MKNFISVKTLFLIRVLVISIFTLSCNQEHKKEISNKSIAQQLNESRFKNTQQLADAQFLVTVAEMNMIEIQLSQLAQKNAYHTDLRELGKMMVRAHSNSMSELIELAKEKSISIPSTLNSDNEAQFYKLKNREGISFDRAYCDLMICHHETAIEMFEKIASSHQSDADIKHWANVSLNDLRSHLEYAQLCKERM